jgi:hypothetical protein
MPAGCPAIKKTSPQGEVMGCGRLIQVGIIRQAFAGCQFFFDGFVNGPSAALCGTPRRCGVGMYGSLLGIYMS